MGKKIEIFLIKIEFIMRDLREGEGDQKKRNRRR